MDPSCIMETKRGLKAANGTPITTLGEITMTMAIEDIETGYWASF